MSGVAGTETFQRRQNSSGVSARKRAWLVGGLFALLFALLFQYRALSLLKKLGWPVTPLGSRFPLGFDFQHAPVWALPFLYTADYLNAVWSATLIGLFLGGAASAFLPHLVRRYLSGDGLRHQVAGALLGLPNMLCSCCAVGPATALRKAGASQAAALSFFVAAPTLNFVTVVLAFQLLPLKLALARVVLGVVAVLGVSYVTSRLGPEKQYAPVPAVPPPLPENLGAVLRTWLRHTAQIARTVLPVLLGGFLLIGLIRTFVPVEALASSLGDGVLPTVLAALVGTVLMIPTFTEVVWVAEFTRHGMGIGPAVALLVTLPSVSLPSLWALGRTVNAKAAACVGALMMALGIAGGLLASLL